MAADRPRTTRTRSRNTTPTRPTAPVAGAFVAAQPDPTATFASLGIPAELIAVLAGKGVTSPFPIQTATLPHSLAGRDVLGRGRTGSGKTYAFAIPLVARLADDTGARQARAGDMGARQARAGEPTRRRPGRPRALILAPTRELVSQIEASLAPLAAAMSLRTMTVFGGVGHEPQIRALRAGVDIVIACPGRLADHIDAGHASLDAVEITVLDEADHMADLGFLPVVRRLLDQTPRDGQRLLFSATLDAGVDVLVQRYLTGPVTVNVDPERAPVSTMTHHVLHVAPADRLPVLVDLTAAPGRTLVFTRTKHRTKALTRQLVASGVPAVELHGNLAQNARTRNLQAFTDGSARTLVATDIAARGIHVDDITLVIHADPPAEHKAYLHRSGRTARAGASGTVVTLMTDDQVADVQALARQAGITPTTTRLRPGHELLAQLAPGDRTFVTPRPAEAGEPVTPAGRSATSPRPARRRATAVTSGHSGVSSTDQGARGRSSSGRAIAGKSPSGTAAPQRLPGQGGAGGAGRSGAAAFSASSRVGRRGR